MRGPIRWPARPPRADSSSISDGHRQQRRARCDRRVTRRPPAGARPAGRRRRRAPRRRRSVTRLAAVNAGSRRAERQHRVRERRSPTTNATSASNAASTAPHRRATRPCAGHAISPYVEPGEPDARRAPPRRGRCGGRPAGPRDSGTCRDGEHDAPATASGRLIRKTQRQPSRLDEPAAEERADRAGDAAEAGPGADRPAAVLLPEGRLQDGEAARGQQRAADALQRPGRTSSLERRGERAEQRGGREPDDPDHEDPAAAEPVAERAAEQDQRGQRERVAVDGPLQPGERRRRGRGRSPAGRR